MPNHLLTLHTLSPLHCGTGQAVGAIELPIAREKPTHIPIVPGSSLKGVLRAERQDANLQKLAFGPDTTQASEHAGAIQFSDARLVLLPMRSLKGVFAWTTSPYLLQRLRKDLELAGLKPWRAIPSPKEGECHVPKGSLLVHQEKVVLDDLDFTAQTGDAAVNEVAELLGRLFFGDEASVAPRLCIVPDDVMSLLLEMGTELQTRVCLDPDTKTVKKGQLWQEEHLPVESLLVALVQVGTVPDASDLSKHLSSLCSRNGGKATLQFGGKSTVGKGLCQVGLVKGN